MAEELDGGQLGFNVDPVKQAVEVLQKTWGDYNGSILNVIKAHVRFNETGQVVGVALQGMTDANRKFTASLKATEEGFRLTSLAAKTLNQTFEENYATTQEAESAITRIVQGETEKQNETRAAHREQVLKGQAEHYERLRQAAIVNNENNYATTQDAEARIGRIFSEANEQREAAQQAHVERTWSNQQNLYNRLLQQALDYHNRERNEVRAQQLRISELMREGQVTQFNANVANQFRGQLAGQINLGRGTPEQIQSINRALDQMVEHIRGGEVSATRLGQIMHAVASRSAENFQGLERSVADSVIRLRGAVGQLADRHAEFGRVAVDANQHVIISWQTMLRFVQYHFLYQGFQLFINAAKESIAVAEELSIRIGEIRTISQTAQQTTEAWTAQVKQLSDQFGRPEIEVAEGLYQTLSNQIAKGAEATQFMSEAMRFGAITVATTDEAVNLLSSAINAYHFQASDAERISAIFFKTIELGRVRAGEMANTIGRILPLAKAMGVTFEEANAAIATLTISGVRYNEAFTLINNLMSELAKPSAEMKKLFHEWGVESGEAAIKTFGFVGVLQRIETATNGASGEIAKIFPNLRGLRAELGLSGSAFDRYKETLDKITNDALPNYRATNADVFQNSGKLIEIELTKVKNYFIQSFGQPAIETLLQISNAFGGLTSAIQFLQKWVIIGAAAWAAYAIQQRLARLESVQLITGTVRLNSNIAELPTLFRIATLGGNGFWASTLAGLRSVITPANVLTGIIAGMVYYWSSQQEAALAAEHAGEDALARLEPIYKKQHDMIVAQVDTETRLVEAGLRKQFESRSQYVAKVLEELFKLEEAQKEATKNAFEEVRAATESELDEIKKGISEVERLAARALENAKTAQKMIDEIHGKAESRTFEFNVEFGDPLQKAELVKTRIAQLHAEIAQLTVGSVTPEQGAENLSLVKEKTGEITRLLTDQAREHHRLDKERLAIEQRITELKEKNQGKETIRVDEAKIRETRDAIVALEAEKPTSHRRQTELQKEIAEKRAALTLAMRGERDTLGETRSAEQARRDAEELADLQKKVDLITGQESSLPDLINLKKQVADLDRQETDQLRQFIDLQKQQADAAKKAAEEQRKQLDQLKQYFKELYEFKLPKDLKEQGQMDQALGKFDELFGKISEAGGMVDQNAYIKILELRKQLTKEADLEIQKNTLETQSATEEKMHQNILKHQQDVANGIKSNDDQHKADVAKLKQQLVDMDALATKIGQRHQLAGLDKAIEDVAAQITKFEKSNAPQDLITLQKQFGDVEELLVHLHRLANPSLITWHSARKAGEIFEKEPSLTDKGVSLQDLSNTANEAIRDLLAKVIPEKRNLDAAQQSVEVELKKMGVSLDAQRKQAEQVSATMIRYGATFRDEMSNSAAALKQLDDAIRETAKRIGGTPIPSTPAGTPLAPVSSNITIPAINVTIQSSGTAPIDAVAIGNAINDAIRRGQLSLG